MKNNKENTLVTRSKQGKDAYIRNVDKINLIATKGSQQNKTIKYKYVFGDDNRSKSTTRVDDSGITTNTRLVLVEIDKNDVKSAILHIWLHRWWY